MSESERSHVSHASHWSHATNETNGTDETNTTAQINDELLSSLRPPSRRWYLLVLLLGAVIAWGLFAFTWQLTHGLYVTGLDRPVMWVASTLKNKNPVIVKEEQKKPEIIKNEPPSNQSGKSKEERLKELKNLFEKDLITKEEYEKAKQKILEEQ
jgi:hypothetical protein